MVEKPSTTSYKDTKALVDLAKEQLAKVLSSEAMGIYDREEAQRVYDSL